MRPEQFPGDNPQGCIELSALENVRIPQPPNISLDMSCSMVFFALAGVGIPDQSNCPTFEETTAAGCFPA